MEQIFDHPDLWKAIVGIVGLVVILVIYACIYSWFKKGGLYYRQYPIAGRMNEMSKNGELKGVDIELAMQSIDPSASKDEQVISFNDAVAAQKY